MKTLYITSALLLLITPVLLSGQKSVFTFPFENSYRLPSMRTEINTDEISSTYQTMGNIFTTEITGLGDNTMEQTSMSYISDVKVVDAVRFLEFYMEEHLVAPGDKSHGQVNMSIIYYHEHSRMNVGSVLGILTIGLGTLLGIPFSTVLVDVETEASFYDKQNSHLATHRGVGRGKKLQSLYSYSTRKAHQRALRHSLDDLNTRIMTDPSLSPLKQ